MFIRYILTGLLKRGMCAMPSRLCVHKYFIFSVYLHMVRKIQITRKALLKNNKYFADIRSDDSVQAADDRSTSDFALPVVLHRYQSMQSLRHRRDPNYNGMRSRRAKRVIDKTGERNVGFLNIPERSWRFFKDFFTTLVSLNIFLHHICV